MAHDKACVDSNARILPKHPVIGVQVKSHQETRDVGTRHGGSQSQEKWGGGSGNLSLAYNSGNPLCQLVMTTAVLSFIIIVIISGSGSMASTSMQLPSCWLWPKPRLTCPYWTLMKSQCGGTTIILSGSWGTFFSICPLSFGAMMVNWSGQLSRVLKASGGQRQAFHFWGLQGLALEEQ